MIRHARQNKARYEGLELGLQQSLRWLPREQFQCTGEEKYGHQLYIAYTLTVFGTRASREKSQKVSASVLTLHQTLMIINTQNNNILSVAVKLVIYMTGKVSQTLGCCRQLVEGLTGDFLLI